MSESKPRNPPLFWQIETREPGVQGPVVTSITLRDLFAAAALAGLCVGESYQSFEAYAHDAYKMADAMLAAREQGDGE